jgi:hypothetical protein
MKRKLREMKMYSVSYRVRKYKNICNCKKNNTYSIYYVLIMITVAVVVVWLVCWPLDPKVACSKPGQGDGPKVRGFKPRRGD